MNLAGTTPLLMHNTQLADPDNKWAKAISVITSKREKTEDDRVEIAHLEFLGGLYVGTQGPFIPAANVRRCLNEAAKARSLGKDVLRAVIPAAPEFPLAYQGPRDPEKLWQDAQFRYQTLVKVRGKVQRTRPQFSQWTLSTEWELLTDILDLDDFKRIANAAGKIEGLGDNRINGFGRFTVEIADGTVSA